MTPEETKLIETLEKSSGTVLGYVCKGPETYIATPARLAAWTFAVLVGCALLGAATAMRIGGSRE